MPECGGRGGHRLARRWSSRQVGDLLDEVDITHHHAGLGIVVKFAGVVEDADITGHVELGFVFIRNAHVIRGPRDAAGEVPDLDGDLAGNLALDVPLQSFIATRRKGGIDQIHLILLIEDAEFDARRIDERIRPGELNAIYALFHGQQAVLADHGNVFRIVNRELRAFTGRQRDQIDGGQSRRDEGQREEKPQSE